MRFNFFFNFILFKSLEVVDIILFFITEFKLYNKLFTIMVLLNYGYIIISFILLFEYLTHYYN
jgi:hypothetical protein